MTEAIKVGRKYYDADEINLLIRKLNNTEEKLNTLRRQYQMEDTEIRRLKDKAERFDNMSQAILDCVMEDLEDKFEWRRD